MADPHIQSPMDFLDKLTVVLYRTGFAFAALAMACFSPFVWNRVDFVQLNTGYYVVLVAATLCASSLHIYLKPFRLLLQFATWSALLCHLFGLDSLALGGALLTLGGLAFKEYFCFRVPTLNLMPIFVALLWVGLVWGIEILCFCMPIICAVLFAILFIMKCRMPLHFDIGDKTKYQI